MRERFQLPRRVYAVDTTSKRRYSMSCCRRVGRIDVPRIPTWKEWVTFGSHSATDDRWREWPTYYVGQFRGSHCSIFLSQARKCDLARICPSRLWKRRDHKSLADTAPRENVSVQIDHGWRQWCTARPSKNEWASAHRWSAAARSV